MLGVATTNTGSTLAFRTSKLAPHVGAGGFSDADRGKVFIQAELLMTSPIQPLYHCSTSASHISNRKNVRLKNNLHAHNSRRLQRVRICFCSLCDTVRWTFRFGKWATQRKCAGYCYQPQYGDRADSRRNQLVQMAHI